MPSSGPYMELSPESRRTINSMRRAHASGDLRKALIEASAPLPTAIKRVALALPSTRGSNPRDGSLRRKLANAVTRRVRVGGKSTLVAITVVPRGGKANIARAVEGEIPWEHPTFGHEPKVTQEPTPFFYKTVEKYAPYIEARVQRVLDEFARKIK